MDAIAIDVHPLIAPEIEKELSSRFSITEDRSGNSEELSWDVHWITEGLGIYENQIQPSYLQGGRATVIRLQWQISACCQSCGLQKGSESM